MPKKATHSQEDYLEAIHLLNAEKSEARILDIAEKVGVGKSSASLAVKKLQVMGLVNHNSYGSVTLSADGEEIARKIFRRHRAFREFFISMLGLPEEIADADACNMEHYASQELADRLVEYLDFLREHPLGGISWSNNKGFFLTEGNNEQHR